MAIGLQPQGGGAGARQEVSRLHSLCFGSACSPLAAEPFDMWRVAVCAGCLPCGQLQHISLLGHLTCKTHAWAICIRFKYLNPMFRYLNLHLNLNLSLTCM